MRNCLLSLSGFVDENFPASPTEAEITGNEITLTNVPSGLVINDVT